MEGDRYALVMETSLLRNIMSLCEPVIPAKVSLCVGTVMRFYV